MGVSTRTTTLGVLFATTTAVVWGGQFVVGKSALESIDAFPLTTVRYAFAAALWLIVLVVLEGPRSLRLDGRGWRLFWLGSLGFAGFNLFAYTGLAHARAESASLIVALGPLLTALVLWQRTRVRPSRATFALLGVALLGVALVVSQGHPARIFEGAIGWGEGLVLAGVFSFVLYSLGAAEFQHLSALRYTALTASLGWFTIAAATAVAVAESRVSFQTVIVCHPEMMFWTPCAVASWPVTGIGLRPADFRAEMAALPRPSLAAATPWMLFFVFTSICSKIVPAFWLSQPGVNCCGPFLSVPFL